MYRVLYRKYRPFSFADVWGQPQVTELLRRQIMTDRLAHAYLFTGSRGIGKTTCAKILAKAVNCLHPNNGDPCNECDVCRGIDEETIHEVVEMDAASNNGVGDVRDLQERLMFPPTQAKFRVYIIDEVHMLSPSAFNALLKTLEEPPDNVIFILATTEVHQIPATILSRCQRMDFRRISAEDISGRLHEIASAEGGELDEDAALLIGRIADGGMRDAVSLLDQCMARDTYVTEDTVREAAGLADPEYILKISGAIRDRDAAGVLALVDELHRLSKDMQRLCSELISHYRSLMVINSVKHPEQIIVATTEQLSRLKEDAARYPIQAVMSILDTLQLALEHMGKGVDRRTELELALLRICRRGADESEESASAARMEAAEKRLAALERAVSEGIPAAQPRVAAPSRKDPGMSPAQLDRIRELSDRAQPFDEWGSIMADLEKRNQMLFSMLNGSRAYAVDNMLLIDATPVARELLRKDLARTSIKQAMQAVLGREYSLGPYQPSSRIVEEQRTPAQTLLDAARQGGVPVTED